MSRPKTVSDQEVLTAALQVLGKRGPGFTLTDLAEQVGLSRATIIQRFGDRSAILLRMAEQEVAETRAWLDSLPVEQGPQALWRFLQQIVGSMGSGEGFTVRVTIAALEAEDPALRRLAGERYGLVQQAIAARLPHSPNQIQTAMHLHAIIAGATMQWVASDGSSGLSEFVLDRLKWAVDHIPPLA
ncbi:MAG: TetR/AcrR family transcriptional regulator [Rhizobium sp.]|nr:TetR/AcrR family transcriptional regulator [Rhizobium sp.]